MKKLKLIFILSFLIYSSVGAQNLEFKVDAFGLFYDSPSFFCEYLIKDDISFELGMQTRNLSADDDNGVKGHNLYLAGRYYFRPNYGHDRFYIGFFLRGKNEYHYNSSTSGSTGSLFGGFSSFGGEDYKDTGVSAGMIFGRKIVSRSGLTIDILCGFGRAYLTRSTLQEETNNFFFSNNDGPQPDFLFAVSVGYRLGGRVE